MALVDPIAINGGRTDDPRYPANSRKYPANQGLNAMNTVGEFTDTGSNNNPYRNAVDQNPNTTSAYNATSPAASPKQDYTDALYGSGAGNGAGAGAGGGYGTTTTTTTETPAYKGDYDLSEYLRQQAAARIENELAGLAGAYEQSMRGYDRELKNIQQNYYNQRNQAAAQDAIARRNFDERAAASGLNSGTAGQADLARSAAYTGELARLGIAEENARADLEMQKANAQSEYEQAMAQARAKNDQDLASALYQEMIRVQGLERQDAQNALKTTTTSSGGGYRTGNTDKKTATGDEDKPLLTAAQARDAIAAGVINDTTRAAYEYYFGQAPEEAAAATTPTATTPQAGSVTNQGVRRAGVDGIPQTYYLIQGDMPYNVTTPYVGPTELEYYQRQGLIVPTINADGTITYSWAK